MILWWGLGKVVGYVRTVGSWCLLRQPPTTHYPQPNSLLTLIPPTHYWLPNLISTTTCGLLLFCSPVFGAKEHVADPAVVSCKSLRSMARVYMASGGYEKARPFLVKALTLARQTNAPDSEVSSCMLDLAYLYKSQGRWLDAEKACRSSLELQEKVYGQDHPYIAYTLRILSDIYSKQARYRRGVETLRRAMTIMRGFCLEDDRELAPFKVDMGRLLTAQGDYVQAESYFKQALASIEGSYGPNHLYTTRVLASIAALYVRQQRFAEAEELVLRVLPVQQRVYGPNHRFLVPVRLVQSSIYEAQGDLVDTRRLLEKSLASIENSADTTGGLECDVLSRLGQLYILSKEYKKAEDILQRGLQILENSNGAQTDREAIALNNLAKVCISQGKYSEAQRLSTRALSILENIFDEYHPDIADVLETQVQLNRATGNTADAERLEQRAEEIRMRERAVPMDIGTPIARAAE
jgi:tetratricopeptide (TPR) repeat protein